LTNEDETLIIGQYGKNFLSPFRIIRLYFIRERVRSRFFSRRASPGAGIAADVHAAKAAASSSA
jgi:hypothetical protein